jgi:hypothetical protein
MIVAYSLIAFGFAALAVFAIIIVLSWIAPRPNHENEGEE